MFVIQVYRNFRSARAYANLHISLAENSVGQVIHSLSLVSSLQQSPVRGQKVAKVTFNEVAQTKQWIKIAKFHYSVSTCAYFSLVWLPQMEMLGRNFA